VTHPEDQTVYEGEQATFSVIATGTSLTYLWRRNGVTIPGALTSSYTTPAVALSEDGDMFQCIISNSEGWLPSNSATLTVLQRTPQNVGDEGGGRTRKSENSLKREENDSSGCFISTVIN